LPTTAAWNGGLASISATSWSRETTSLGVGVNIAAHREALAEPGGICISEDAFRQERGNQSLKNIARPVRVYRAGPTLTHPPLNAPGPPLPAGRGEGAECPRREAGEGSSPLPLPDKPSIAVLSSANMSGDPEQEYFADGMVGEIITALSRIRWLVVITRNSTRLAPAQGYRALGGLTAIGRRTGARSCRWDAPLASRAR
jgi:adenylate cyclase